MSSALLTLVLFSAGAAIGLTMVLFPNRFRRSSDMVPFSLSICPELVRKPRLTAPKLVDMIIDFFHAFPESLISCAIVSCSWRHVSQFHSFSNVSISPDLEECRTDFQTFLRLHNMDTGPSRITIARFAKFCAMLNNSKHIIPLVRTLRIDVCTPMLRNLADVPLTHLEAITIFDCHTGLVRNEVTEHPELKLQYLELMPRILARPTLTRIELYFREREFEPGYFHRCPDLTSLVLHNIPVATLHTVDVSLTLTFQIKYPALVGGACEGGGRSVFHDDRTLHAVARGLFEEHARRVQAVAHLYRLSANTHQQIPTRINGTRNATSNRPANGIWEVRNDDAENTTPSCTAKPAPP
ncbi:hypothetical protein C8R44DRAFT_893986 [Mycena epipterygia]|nr:hypothetical protein C8R44DRAFT_893986 [Mycena epipterygia]